jgi:ATP-dependent Clp protease ATP-binding subunit ClpA
MFGRIKQRMQDMGTVKALCLAAEKHAHEDGQNEPGAEHFMLAALDLPDGSARRVLGKLGVEPDRLRDAIARQHADALSSVGFDPSLLAALNADAPVPAELKPGVYRASASGQALMQALARREGVAADAPMTGAHVLSVIAAMKHGIAARALRMLGIDPVALAAAAAADGGRP